MKTISFWARAHRKSAIALIVVIKISLALLAMCTAITLRQMDVALPANGICIACILGYFVIAYIYPYREKSGFKTSVNYAKQKACDFMLGLLSFLCITAMLNNPDALTIGRPAYGTSFISYPVTSSSTELALKSPIKSSKKVLSWADKKGFRKAVLLQLKHFFKSKFRKQPKSGVITLLFLLAIIAAVGLLYFLALLVCNISCGGAESLAVVVGVLGTGVILGLLLFAIHRILHPKSKRTESKSIKQV